MYKTADETKPDFSLSGVWIEKDVDTAYSTKIAQMNQEESIYGFIANTKATQITTPDITAIQKYIQNPQSANAYSSLKQGSQDEMNLPPLSKGGGTTVPEGSILTDPTNSNRIILKIVNTTKHEPIKANITHNAVDKRIEIRVTYTANGISQILDEYGNAMTLTEENGKIQTDTGSTGLAKGTYYFTVIDNKGNKRELSITPNIDSLFKVAYISGTDNMDINTTYNKTQETISSTESTLLNQVKATDTTKTFSRAIQATNKDVTAIGQQTRTSEDEQWYMYGKYKANSKIVYSIEEDTNYSTEKYKKGYYSEGYHYIYYYYAFQNYSLDRNEGVTLTSPKKIYNDSSYSTLYTKSSSISTFNAYGGGDGKMPSTDTTTTSFYKHVYSSTVDGYYQFKRYKITVNNQTVYSRGDLASNVIALDGTYTIGSSTKVHSDKYWYTRNSLAPKYTLYKYDKDLNLKSTYDVDTKTLLTEPVDISNKGRNKVKLTLTTSGTAYKTYISNDNTNWQEITDITSGTPKELDVDGWSNLYIKIETNTSRIGNIDVAYYKD